MPPWSFPSRPITTLLLLLAVACAPTPEAQSAKASRSKARKLQNRLEQLSKNVAYHPQADDVRVSLQAMSRSVVESLVPAEGYSDVDANRTTPLTCKVDDIYEHENACGQSFVRALRRYRLSIGKGSSGYSAPEWAHGGDTITVTYDAHFFELEFGAGDLKLRSVSYLAQEQ